MSFSGKHILIIVENLSVPFDRRVWQEATALKDHGAMVSVICPRMNGYTKSYEKMSGIDIYRHPRLPEGKGIMAYIAEYSVAIFWQWIYSWKIYLKKRFHVIQGCNPPDLVFLVAAPFKLFGVEYIFDHHDISPELYIAKYSKKGLMHNILLLAEKLTFKVADYCITTNESYKDVAIKRGKMPVDKIQVVRNGPNLDIFKKSEGNSKYKKGRDYLVGYVGVIGNQEGLDLLLETVQYITSIRQDIHFAIIGNGPELENLKILASQMNVLNFVDFYGRVSDQDLLDILNTADVCVNPDRPTEMNNLSTMIKIMEYMSLMKPIVQYDLKEGRISAMDASLYAVNTNPQDFANKIIYLMDNRDVRLKMGDFGYQRIVNHLSWKKQSIKLISFYRFIFGLT